MVLFNVRGMPSIQLYHQNLFGVFVSIHRQSSLICHFLEQKLYFPRFISFVSIVLYKYPLRRCACVCVGGGVIALLISVVVSFVRRQTKWFLINKLVKQVGILFGLMVEGLELLKNVCTQVLQTLQDGQACKLIICPLDQRSK